ncbi:MAG: MoxR family ATPase [Phycisphaerales bacterium]
MQEKTVTGEHYKLERLFFVMATQNLIEQEGTYPLPEAQMDRFLFKIVVGYSQLEDLMTILDRTTGGVTPTVRPLIDGKKILEWQQFVRNAIVAPHVKEYVARLVLATHPEGRFAPGITNRYIRVGASPRGAQALMLAGKVKALTDGRYHVSYKDIAEIARAALRHRLVLNFEAEADRIDPDMIVDEIVKATPHEPVLAGVKG